MTQPPGTPALSVRGLIKRFPGVTALAGVDLDVKLGEVHALLGENGAGKSTLAKILAGVETPSEGEIELLGRPYRPAEPADAINAGVRMVYQELNLLPYLSVAENLFFERLPRRAGMVDFRKLDRDAAALLDEVGLTVSPRTPVERLSVAQMQLVEIAKALSASSRVLIMDEPTATLTRRETERLFDIVRRLARRQVTIIYISHHLREIFEIADRVTVLRNGALVATRTPDGLTVADLVRMMVGRDLHSEFPERDRPAPGRELLRVEGVHPRGLPAPLSFSVRAGELLGVAGLVGSGRTETMRAIFGADPRDGGDIAVAGETIKIRRPRDAVRRGISFLTEDRKGQGLLLPLGSDVNITLADVRRVARAGLLRRDSERRDAGRLVDRLRIKMASLSQPTRNLSGGNQQKVVLARWLYRDSRVLIVDEPTRGVDVGAKYEIHTLLGELAAQGRAVVIVSSDLSELIGICDRIIVFSRGRITGEVAREDFDQERILALAYAGYGAGALGSPAADEPGPSRPPDGGASPAASNEPSDQREVTP
jgi:ribose transport system ATP-binding protein